MLLWRFHKTSHIFQQSNLRQEKTVCARRRPCVLIPPNITDETTVDLGKSSYSTSLSLLRCNTCAPEKHREQLLSGHRASCNTRYKRQVFPEETKQNSGSPLCCSTADEWCVWDWLLILGPMDAASFTKTLNFLFVFAP